MNRTTAKIMIAAILALFFAIPMNGEDARTRPVTARYCDGSSITAYPYSFVSRSDGSTFNCYEVQVTAIPGGFRYAFEDSSDFDYNDIIIDLFISGDGTDQPTAHLRYVSKDASYLHWIHLVTETADTLVFKAEEAAPGQEFSVPLPLRPCPDFHLTSDRESLPLVQGEAGGFNITVVPRGGFTGWVELDVSGLPEGTVHRFYGNPVRGEGSAFLGLTPGAATPAGEYPLKITGSSGSLVRSLDLRLIVRTGPIPEITKWVDKERAKPGDTLSYRIRLNNPGLLNRSVTVTDAWPADLEFLSQESELVFSRESERLQWRGELAAGAAAEILLQGRIPDTTRNDSRIINRAEVIWSDGQEPQLSNPVQTIVNSETASPGQVIFRKRADLRQSDIGRTVRFTLSLENRSRSILAAPVFEDDLPSGFSYIPGTSLLNLRPAGDPTGSNLLHWETEPIRPGETVEMSFQVLIGADARRGRNINHARFHAFDGHGQPVNLEAEEFIQVAAESLIFFSGVEGTVFLDQDGNEMLSPGEPPLSGIEVCLSTGEKSLTDAQGHYSFTSLFPGEYALNLNRSTLPEKYRSQSIYSIPVVLSDGLQDTVDFPLHFRNDNPNLSARISGLVFFDRNGDRRHDPEDPPCTEFTAVLDGRTTTAGNGGRFVFTHLQPGTHKLKIAYGNKMVELEINLRGGDNPIPVPLRFTGIRVQIRGEK